MTAPLPSGMAARIFFAIATSEQQAQLRGSLNGGEAARAEAFRATRRQLSDQLDQRRGFVKTHVVGREGRIGANMNKHRVM